MSTQRTFQAGDALFSIPEAILDYGNLCTEITLGIRNQLSPFTIDFRPGGSHFSGIALSTGSRARVLSFLVLSFPGTPTSDGVFPPFAS
jgi:hypothetical protein